MGAGESLCGFQGLWLQIRFTSVPSCSMEKSVREKGCEQPLRRQSMGSPNSEESRSGPCVGKSQITLRLLVTDSTTAGAWIPQASDRLDHSSSDDRGYHLGGVDHGCHLEPLVRAGTMLE